MIRPERNGGRKITSARQRYVIYMRFSPRPDADTSESIEAQERDLMAHIERQGGELVDRFADPDVSGDDEDRPGLWLAVEAVQKGITLLVWKGDRLARSVYLSEYLHREIEGKGGRIEYLHGRNGDSPDDVLVRQILSAVDEHSKKTGAIRTKHMMLSHQSRGRIMSKDPPYGWMVDPNSPPHHKSGLPTGMVECPAELAAIERIRVLRAQDTGLRAIARQLDDEGHPSRNGAWTHVAVRRILVRLGIE